MKINKLIDSIYKYIFFKKKIFLSKLNIKIKLYKAFKYVYKIHKKRFNKNIIKEIIDKLYQLRKTLELDLETYLKKDPSIKDKNEVILTNKCFYAIYIYRLANMLVKLNVPLLPKMLSSYCYSLSNIDINPHATIGNHFFVDHGVGIVIGETTIIGNNVSIYQGVTLGAISLHKRNLKGIKRHPTIKNNVTLYADSMILGGDTIIGNNVIIGAKAIVTKSVADNEIIKIKTLI